MGRKSNAPKRRAEIVQAMYECLSKSGHEKITVKQIATQAGLPHGVIHYYFTKKDDIVAALVTSLAENYKNLLEQALDGAETPMDRVSQRLELLIEAFVFDRKLNRVFYNLVQMGFERKSVNSPLRKLLMTYRATIENVFSQAGAGKKSRQISCSLVALIEGLALQWMIDPDALEKASVKHMVEQIIRNQLIY